MLQLKSQSELLFLGGDILGLQNKKAAQIHKMWPTYIIISGKMNDLCWTDQTFSVWEVCIRFKYLNIYSKRGDASLSQRLLWADLLCSISFNSWGPALPPLDIGMPRKHSQKWELWLSLAKMTESRDSASHPNLLLPGCRILGKSFYAVGLSTNPESKAELSTALFYSFY